MAATTRSIDKALGYITECTLATVITMHYMKRKSKGEYERQISIAQSGINSLRECNEIILSGRVFDVIYHHNSSVRNWLKRKENNI